jgi:hypothetical protein
MKTKEEKNNGIYSFYIPKNRSDLMSEIQKIRWANKKTLSETVFLALEEYVAKHRDDII